LRLNQQEDAAQKWAPHPRSVRFTFVLITFSHWLGA